MTNIVGLNAIGDKHVVITCENDNGAGHCIASIDSGNFLAHKLN